MEAEEIVHLRHEDDDRDARGESDGHRKRNVFDVSAEPEKPGHHQQQAGDQRREHEAVIAVPVHGERDQRDEGGRRPADLEAAAAQKRDQESADDRRIEPAFRRDAGTDRNRHRQRQGDDGDGQPRKGVGAQIGKAVAFPQHGHELGQEQIAKARGRGAGCGTGLKNP